MACKLITLVLWMSLMISVSSVVGVDVTTTTKSPPKVSTDKVTDSKTVTNATTTNTKAPTTVGTSSTTGTPGVNITIIPTDSTNTTDSTTPAATTTTTTTTKAPPTTVAPTPKVVELKLVKEEVTSTSVTVKWERVKTIDIKKKYKLTIVLTLDGAETKVKDQQPGTPGSHTFKKLDSYKTYKIKAYEKFEDETGPESEEIQIQTLPAKPSIPQNLKIVKPEQYSIEIQWKAPAKLNGKILGSRIDYTYAKYAKSVDLAANIRSYKFKDLYAFVEYTFSVKEKTDEGYGESASIKATTLKAKPYEGPKEIKVTDERVVENGAVEVVITWQPLPSYYRGDEEVSYVVSGLKTTEQKTELSNLEVVLTAYTNYTVSIVASNTIGKGDATTLNFRTRETAPSAPVGVKLIPIRTENYRYHSINISWEAPLSLNGQPRGFMYTYEGKGRYRRDMNKGSGLLGSPPKRNVMVDGLSPYTEYTIKVKEETCVGCWGLLSKEEKVLTKAGIPSSPTGLHKNNIESDSIEIKWRSPNRPNGIIIRYQLDLVNDDTDTTKTKMFDVTGVHQSYKHKFEELEGEAGYTIRVSAINHESIRGNSASVTFVTPQSTTWLFILIGCLVVVLIIVLILSIYLLVSRRRRPYEEVRPTEDIEMRTGTKSKVILLANFKNYVMQQHANSDHGFQQEYETLRAPVRQFTAEQSAMPCNQIKNRYSNIVAYDHSRVTLAAIEDDPSSTYINANYINGFAREKQYIATQGPLPETIIDFWRMIWDQNCPIIVMLTKLVEDNRLKCEQYWPEGKAMQYRDIVVTIMSVKEMTDMTIKVFKLHKINNPELGTREVQHFHYTAWPDHGVPSHPTSMLSFIRHVMSYEPKPPTGPIVVHCSAGVGRTGTFIAIEGCLRQMETDNQVDVFGTVLQMRMQRNFMVQTESQYIFIYDALLDNAICGNTEISPETLVGRIKYLNEADGESGQSRFISEFRRLESGFTMRDKDQVSDASHPENKAKNRFLNILPFDKNRIRLNPIPGMRNSDYINASIVDGFQQKHAFIATQAPLENTVVDFWRMVLEQNVKIIVMLTKIEEKGQEKCYLYWPQAGTVSYGSIHVEVMDVRNQDDVYTIHDLRLTNRDTGKSWPVTHFLYMGWPEYQGSPDNGTDLINFIGTVEKMQKTISDAGPTLVHCSGGVGRTGVFIAVFNSVEMLKSKNVVDVFQTTRNLRLQRSAMVQTIDQYKFCYQCLKDYLDSFDMYRHPEC